jgi:hypothetical protein
MSKAVLTRVSPSAREQSLMTSSLLTNSTAEYSQDFAANQQKDAPPAI